MLTLNPSRKFSPVVFDSKNYLEEQNRRRRLPESDRRLFDMLEAEGQAKSQQNHTHYPVFDGSSFLEEQNRRRKLSPEDREALEFLESAQLKLKNIDDNAGPGFTGGTYLEKQRYLKSLTPEQRELLEKAKAENVERPGGLYPMNRKFTPPASVDRLTQGGVLPRFTQDLALKQMAIRAGRF